MLLVSLHVRVSRFRRVGLPPAGRRADNSYFSDSTAMWSGPKAPTTRRRPQRRWSMRWSVPSLQRRRHERAVD